MNRQNEIKDIINDSELIFADAKEAKITKGWKKAFEYLSEFVRYYDNYDKHTNIITDPFFMLFDLENGDIYAVHDFGRTRILPAFFIPYNLLPISYIGCGPCSSPKALKDKVMNIVAEYQSHIADALIIANGVDAILITGYDGTDNYIGVNLSSGQFALVWEYKTYRDHVFIDGNKIAMSNVYIFLLPDDLYYRLGLYVKNVFANCRCEWNCFEARKPHVKKKIDTFGCPLPQALIKIYTDAVDVLNLSFRRDIGFEKELIQLERDILFLERGAYLVAIEAGVIRRIAENMVKIQEFLKNKN